MGNPSHLGELSVFGSLVFFCCFWFLVRDFCGICHHLVSLISVWATMPCIYDCMITI
ncbi:hypothetical protein C8Q76DRAFT_749682 [Earliella scabrosa]|nr:hypothetical protein C8Q76DRAFT_749682 [Earliella scabrosa]